MICHYIGTLIEKRRLNFVNKLLDVPRLARLFCVTLVAFFFIIFIFFITLYFYYFYSILFSLCLLCVCSYVCLSAAVPAHVANKDKENTIYNKRRNHETVEKRTRPVNDIQYNGIIRSQVMQLMNSSQLKTISIPNETVHRMI